MLLLFGPRLDRPSAIGDEGRPRAASLAAATAVFGAVAVAVGLATNLGEPLRTLALGAALVVAGTALLDRDSPAALAAGHLCFLPGGIVALAGLAMGALGGVGSFLFLSGTAVAVLGLGGAWANVDGSTLVRATNQGWGAAFVPVVGLILAAVVGSGAYVVWILGVAPPWTPGVASLFGLVALAVWTVRYALARLPLSELAHRDRVGTVEARVDRARSVLKWVAVLAAVGWGLLGVIEVLGVLEALSADPAVAGLVATQGSIAVRVPLFAVAVASLAAVTIAGGLRRLTRDRSARSVRFLAPVAGGLALAGIPTPLFMFVAGDEVSNLVGVSLFAFALVVVVLAAALFLLLFSLGPLALTLGLLPDRAGAASLASAGTLLAAVGAGVLGLRPVLVFATVAAAMVVWDVTEFGVGLTVELGHRPETRRLELVHAVAAVGVAAVAVVGATAAGGLFRVVGTAEPVVPAMVLAVAGVLLLLAPLRG